MTRMSSETMMQANGGKYRYQCLKCGSKSRTLVAMVLHMATNHLGGPFKKI
ncbi:MAG: hypothetical protein J5501_06115 [Ruminococcus sp.]|nr:hypothetical protein [Ruminococcus sp.]